MRASNGVESRLELACRLALEAQGLILRHYSASGVRFENKADGTPVTVADRGAEEIIRGGIERAFPDDGVIGEEHGERAGRSDYRWVIDPIDGTKAFVHGVPLFGTLIGVQRKTETKGEPSPRPAPSGRGSWSCIAGVARFAALDECVWAARGGGAWHTQRGETSPRPCRVSRVVTLAEATVCFTSPQAMLEVGEPSAAAARGTRGAFVELNRRAKLTRGWSDCYGTLLVATGRIEVMIDPPMKLWDVAALIPIIEEAGGKLTGWDGRETDGSTGAIASNGLVHGEVVEVMGGEPDKETGRQGDKGTRRNTI